MSCKATRFCKCPKCNDGVLLCPAESEQANCGNCGATIDEEEFTKCWRESDDYDPIVEMEEEGND